MKTMLITAIFLLNMWPVFASQEGVLPFSEFRIQSEGVSESGMVVVEGLKDTSGNYKRLSIKAFGKVIEVSDELLRQIPSKYQNGIQLSYEGGYKEVGGRTIYIAFLSGFTSGVRETFIIAVTEDGRQSILRTP